MKIRYFNLLQLSAVQYDIVQQSIVHCSTVQKVHFSKVLHIYYSIRNVKARGEVTSGPLFLYWLAAVVCGAPEFRYYSTQYTIHFVLCTVHFVLCTVHLYNTPCTLYNTFYTVKPLITNTSEEFIKCRLDNFSMSFILYQPWRALRAHLLN